METLIVFILTLELILGQQFDLTEVNYNVNVENGETVVTVPLPFPKGVKSLQPKISLSYRSNQYLTNREIGLGWYFSDFIEISRCPKSYYFDNGFNPIKNDYTDVFCLNGQRLILSSGTYGYNGSEYQTEIEGYKKIVAYGAQGLGPKYFKIFTKEDLIMTIGEDSNATLSQLTPNFSNITTISSWYINRIQDYSNNKIDFIFKKEINYCYLDRIDYASNRSAQFVYEDRIDVQKRFYKNLLNFNISKRLKNIQFFVNKQEIKNLALQYLKYGETQSSLLQNIKICSLKLCSMPLAFEYDIQDAKFSKIQYINAICGTSDICELKQMADTNGDGMMDVIGFGNDGVYVSLNDGSNFLPAKIWIDDYCSLRNWVSSKHLRFIKDLNKDGLPDIIGFFDDGVYVSLNDDGLFKPKEKWTSDFSYSGSWRVPTNLRFLSDINNDGYPDIVGIKSTGIVGSIFLNNSYQSSLPLTRVLSYAASVGWGSKYPLDLVDLNGDDLKEIAGIGDDLWISELSNAPEIRPVKNQNAFFYKFAWRIGQNTRFFNDMNNDNLVDIIGFANSKAWIGYSSVDNTSKNVYDANFTAKGFSTVENKIQRSSDINADGYLDLISFECNGVYVAINNGKTINDASLWVSDLKSCDTDTRDVQDVNGDGLVDLIGFYGNTVKVFYNLNKKPKLIKITDSLSNTKRITYQTLATQNRNNRNNLTKGTSFTEYGLNREIVNSLVSSNGIGGYSTINYEYGPIKCGTVKQDCTFSWIRSINRDDGIILIDDYYQEYPRNGIVKRKRSYSNDKLIYDKTFEYIVKKSNFNNMVLEVLLQTKKVDVFDLNGIYLKSETSEQFYDNFGNIYKSVENITNNQVTYSHTNIFQYRINKSEWWISELLSKIQSRFLKNENGSINFYPMKEEYYEYNRTIRLISKKTYQPNDNVGLEETYSYDTFGNNILIVQKALKTLEIRKKYFEYDLNGVNIIVRKNDLLHQETYKYDLNDNVIELSDINKLVSSYSYDQFGRKLRETEAQGRLKTWSYEWDTPSTLLNSVYKITNVIDNTIKKTTYYDSLNRVIRISTIGLNGELICEDSFYDSSSQLVKQSMPYKLYTEIPKYKVFEYDILYREVNKTEVYEKGISISTEYYPNKIVKKDGMGRLTISTTNILGQIISIEDAYGTIAYYDYDLNGNLLKMIDPQGISISMTYDINNNKISKNDPLKGLANYFYNAFDELISTKVSNGPEILFERDSIGRMKMRTESDAVTKWEYDNPVNGIGKLYKTVGPNDYYSEMKYDNFSRLVEQFFQYDKIVNFSVITQYDKLGRVILQTYPSNEKIYQCYNNNGYLFAVSSIDSSCNSYSWKILDSDARGNLKQEIYGNNIVTDSIYNEAFQVVKLTSSLNYNTKRKLEYEYDRRQNLISKIDYDFRGSTIKQKYEYDLLNRIISATSFENKEQKQGDSSSWMYDSIGNLIFVHDPVERLFKYNDTKPQQAIQIGTESLKYDNFGNVIETDAYLVNWYSFSKAKQIKTQNQHVSFKYGPERDLIVKYIVNGTMQTTIYYIGNVYEKWIINTSDSVQIMEKYHSRVLEKIVSTKTTVTNLKNNVSSSSIVFLHYDPFNSIDSITDKNGGLVLKYSYSPFGKSRIVYSNLTSEALSFYKPLFSDHYQMDIDRLIDMNGRIYDLVFMRFLSADAFIQDIYNIQNFNRYTYALNNPFKFKDPTGHSWRSFWKAITNPKTILAIAVGIATSGIASTLIAPALIAGTSSIATGAISGAVIGSASAFGSTMVLTNGNLGQSLQAAAFGGISGGLSGEYSSIVSNIPGLSSGNEFTKFAGELAFQGTGNVLQKKKFTDGMELSILSFTSANAYKSVVGYEITIESGGEAVQKGFNSPPVKGANNIGVQGYPVDLGSLFNEGGVVSRLTNKIGGINAISGLHDTFQINLPGASRDILNIPGMPVAAYVTYIGLYNQIKCPLC